MRIFLMISTLFSICYAVSSPVHADKALCHDADTIFTHATFITLNPQKPLANAVAVTKGRIVGVGDEDTIFSECRGKQTKLIDLKNAYVTPGFIDIDAQFILFGWLANHALDLSTTNVFQRPDWQPIRTTEHFLNEIKTHTPTEHQWFIVHGYDAHRLRGDPLTTEALDAVTNRIPTIVFYTQGNQAILNQAAINAIQTNPNLQSIHIQDGGMIQKAGLNTLLNTLINEQDAKAAIQTASDYYARRGYTTITETEGTQWLPLYDALTENAQLPVDIIYTADTIGQKKRLNTLYQDNPRLYAGPLLIQMDGSAQDFSAFLSEPYFKKPPEQATKQRGSFSRSPKDLEQTIMKAQQEGLSMAIESHGDAATDFAINILQRMPQPPTSKIPKPIFLNMQFLRNDQFNRLQWLGVKAGWFGPELYYWGEAMCHTLLGPERAHQIMPLATAYRIAHSNSAHAGAPATPPDPLNIMDKLTTRQVQKWQHPANKTCPYYFGLEERISQEDALRMFTVNAAELYGLEAEKGSIETGKIADMTLLDKNPLETSLQTIAVMGTIHRGLIHWYQSAKPPESAETQLPIQLLEALKWRVCHVKWLSKALPC